MITRDFNNAESVSLWYVPANMQDYDFCKVTSNMEILGDRLPPDYIYYGGAHQISPPFPFPFELVLLVPKEFDKERIKKDLLHINPPVNLIIEISSR